MSKKGILIRLAAGLGALIVCFVLYAYYELTHIRIPFTPQEISNAEIAVKGAMGEAIFTGHLKPETVPAEQLKGKSGLDALFAAIPPGSKGPSLIEAYRKDPEKFKRYADMFDTVLNAK